MKHLLHAVFMLCLVPAFAQSDVVLGALTKKQKPQSARLLFDEAGRAVSIVTLKHGRQLHVTDEALGTSKTFQYEYRADGEASSGLLFFPPDADEMLGKSQLVLERVADGYLHEYYVATARGHLSVLRTQLATGQMEMQELLSLAPDEYPIHLQQTPAGLIYVVMQPKANLFRLHRMGYDGNKSVNDLPVDLKQFHADGRLDPKKDAHLGKMFTELMMLDLIDTKAIGVADSLRPGRYHNFEDAAGMWKKYHIGDTLVFFTNSNSGLSLLQFSLVPASNSLTVRALQSPAGTLPWVQRLAPEASTNYTNLTSFDKAATPVSFSYSQQYFALLRVDKPHLYIQFFDRATGELRHMEYWSPLQASALQADQIKNAPWFVDSSQNKPIETTKFLNVAVAALGVVAFELVDVSPDSVAAILMVKDERIKLSDVAGAVISTAASFVPVGSLVGAFAVGAAGSIAGDLSEAALSMAENKEVYCLSRHLDARTLAAPVGAPVAPMPALKNQYDEARALQQRLSPGMSVVAFGSHGGRQYLSYLEEGANAYKLRKLQTLQAEPLALKSQETGEQ